MNDPLPREIRRLAMFCHLSGLAWIPLFMVMPVPGLGLVVPVIVWQQNRDRHPFIMAAGKAAVNFQLSCLIYTTIAFLLMGFLWFTACGMTYSGYSGPNRTSTADSSEALANLLFQGGAIVALGLLLFTLTQTIMIIFAAIKADRGQSYNYPWAIRFLK